MENTLGDPAGVAACRCFGGRILAGKEEGLRCTNSLALGSVELCTNRLLRLFDERVLADLLRRRRRSAALSPAPLDTEVLRDDDLGECTGLVAKRGNRGTWCVLAGGLDNTCTASRAFVGRCSSDMPADAPACCSSSAAGSFAEAGGACSGSIVKGARDFRTRAERDECNLGRYEDASGQSWEPPLFFTNKLPPSASAPASSEGSCR
mmetsp:Transcript_25181/g.47573  ORF Transcript_25181/g.47573 Transcript_25181/m.47573 type:complete len:207 (+) Transcript_25181:616-1236(+)